MGRPSRNASAAIAHTAFTGVPVHALSRHHTRCKGTPPSRANANSMLNGQRVSVLPEQARLLQIPDQATCKGTPPYGAGWPQHPKQATS